ncbi:hypothetical protein P5673_019561 [Acropora cervicornis]|uniref:Uncharacterized protein n=1 Tax=Acropora cervicornis TaxID=6130 RepID=A0AAD9QB08_ACRCE|nr:hypothetical protein P5673_019561 [Acropora cervicornis]
MMLGEGVETEKLGSKVDKKARKITSQLQAKMIRGTDGNPSTSHLCIKARINKHIYAAIRVRH